ncbi:hypothetical protein [Streptomyces huasconensis]|uniref:hypothetical protein n=1 Tax=Streptomyces huasconensis TaxID=1854574 RepID=UPI0036FF038C
MEQRAGQYGVLPRSTAHRIVNKRAMPHTLQQLQAHLRACEVPEAEWPDWESAWNRAQLYEKHDEVASEGFAPEERLREAMEKAYNRLGRWTTTPEVQVVLAGEERVPFVRGGGNQFASTGGGRGGHEPHILVRAPHRSSRSRRRGTQRPVQPQLPLPANEQQTDAPGLF